MGVLDGMEEEVTPEFILGFSDGRRVATGGNGIVGRYPAAYTVTTELDDPAAVELVTVDEGAKLVSRAHLAFGQYQGVFWVADLGSANRTSIEYRGDGVIVCEPFVRYEVDAAAIVRFGGMSFELLDGLSASAPADAPLC